MGEWNGWLVTGHAWPEFVFRQRTHGAIFKLCVAADGFGQDFSGSGRVRWRGQAAENFIGKLQALLVGKAQNSRFDLLQRAQDWKG